MKRANIYELIDLERDAQNEADQWCNLSFVSDTPLVQCAKLSVLVEEVGEVSTAIMEGEELVGELLQVAAVAVAWLESIELHRTEEHDVQGDE